MDHDAGMPVFATRVELIDCQEGTIVFGEESPESDQIR